MRIICLMIVALSLGLVPSLYATPVTYNMTLTINSASSGRYPCDGFTFPQLGCFDPMPVPGDIFYGSFTIDDAILSSDGIKSGVLSSFRIEISNYVWDMNVDNPFFSGWRGPIPEYPQCTACLGAASPGFVVRNGIIVGLTGGLVGRGDATSVDFYNGSDPYSPAINNLWAWPGNGGANA
jgi:hypothetical protein